MSTEQERAAFEALAKEQGWELDKYPGSVGAYVEPDTAAAWLAYRAAQAAPEFSDAAWALAQKVRTDLDRQSCPGVYMDIAMESIARNLAAAPVQAVPKEPLFLLHTGGLYGNERDAWEVQANSQAAVDELCNAQPLGAVLHLYALTPAAPQVPAVQVGHVYRYGSDSKGLAWHGIYWNHAGIDLPDGTPLYAGAPPSSPGAAPQPAEPKERP